ncbi:MAG: tetratricopeptide repeat protein, partial [Pseudonocardiaceae bacterium]
MSDTASGQIFLSYRRDDTQHVAGRLRDRLAERFGDANVFMDVDSIEPGLDFSEAIERAVGGCDVLLALIGTRWLRGTDEHGRRRLDDPDDLVRLEIKSALDRDVLVIPVLVDRAAAPRRDDLPEILAPLARRHAVPLDHETFRTDMVRLIDALDRAVQATAERARDRDEDTHSRYRQVLGDDHPSTLALATNLAAELSARGRHQWARELDEDTHSRYGRVLGDDHLSTLASATNLATDLRALGEYQRARELDEDTHSRYGRVLGDDHLSTLASANNLATD